MLEDGVFVWKHVPLGALPRDIIVVPFIFVIPIQGPQSLRVQFGMGDRALQVRATFCQLPPSSSLTWLQLRQILKTTPDTSTSLSSSSLWFFDAAATTENIEGRASGTHIGVPEHMLVTVSASVHTCGATSAVADQIRLIRMVLRIGAQALHNGSLEDVPGKSFPVVTEGGGMTAIYLQISMRTAQMKFLRDQCPVLEAADRLERIHARRFVKLQTGTREREGHMFKCTTPGDSNTHPSTVFRDPSLPPHEPQFLTGLSGASTFISCPSATSSPVTHLERERAV
ncbi:hypothetical protein EDD16DRAFT_1514649 [Pisolithus croceorrhizus]|nr:hypothetical protein EDD16DRAFT_1514649 [Pisolithus croceorrhizus]KAI6145331.1 hypothetical protein EDD17DRAFT_1901557 [Pisolithus thermaeus]